MQKKSSCELRDYIGKTIGLSFTDKGSAKEMVKGFPRYLKIVRHGRNRQAKGTLKRFQRQLRDNWN
jgi:hypothetical protein